MNTIDFNTKKLSLIPRMFVAVLFFCFILPAQGQEYIRESSTEISDTSIIRRGKNDSVWIYNKFFDDKEMASFMLETTGNNTPEAFFFDSLYINDFEIFGGMIYLCGYKYVEEGRMAIFGSFRISQFPNCDIYYDVVEDCKEFKKIDVYKTVQMQYVEESHLVMTGTSDGTRSDVLVDITMPFNAPFYGQIYRSNNEFENLDDVAVTKNYIVVSTRNRENGIPLIYYWQFPKPQLIGQDIFSAPMDRIRVSSPVPRTPVFLEYTNDDKYAAVYRNSGFPQIEMSLLEAPNTVSSGFTIYGSLQNNRLTPQDIKYNKNSNVYDILARNSYKFEDYVIMYFMRIYHVTSDELNSISILGKGTEYTENEVWSIDPASSGYFFASGTLSWRLRLYRYKFDRWINCPEKFEYPYSVGKPEWNYVGKYAIPVLDLDFTPMKKETDNKVILFPIVCEEE